MDYPFLLLWGASQAHLHPRGIQHMMMETQVQPLPIFLVHYIHLMPHSSGLWGWGEAGNLLSAWATAWSSQPRPHTTSDSQHSWLGPPSWTRQWCLANSAYREHKPKPTEPGESHIFSFFYPLDKCKLPRLRTSQGSMKPLARRS
jgi:hypothetical protein